MPNDPNMGVDIGLAHHLLLRRKPALSRDEAVRQAPRNELRNSKRPLIPPQKHPAASQRWNARCAAGRLPMSPDDHEGTSEQVAFALREGLKGALAVLRLLVWGLPQGVAPCREPKWPSD